MATTVTGVSIEEYLRTSYTPDREYLDGELREKAMVGFPHGKMQVILGTWFQTHAREWRIQVAVETRTRVAAGRVRLPDLVVVPAEVCSTGALDAPPLIAIEVLSPEDAYSDLRQRATDLRAMGTKNIWLMDPSEKSVATWDGLTWQLFSRRET
jgi:Uma2 family endonuclease